MKQPILRLQSVSECSDTAESALAWPYLTRSRNPISPEHTGRVVAMRETGEKRSGREIPADSSAPSPEGILEAWKDIAAYLKRDVRTVQRWEKSMGLPVHRLQDSRSGSVFAYQRELDRWRDQRALQIARDRLPVASSDSPPVPPSAKLPQRATLWLAAVSGVVVGAAGSTVVFLVVNSIFHHSF